jgi:hypothetical protein
MNDRINIYFQYYTEITAIQWLIKRDNKIYFIFSAFSDTLCIFKLKSLYLSLAIIEKSKSVRVEFSLVQNAIKQI